MVFSQTSLNTHTALKVVELDHLKRKKKNHANGSTGVVTGGYSNGTPSSPVATSSFAEEFLKSEPLFETSTMFHDTDYEFFQDLVPWSSAPAKEELVQTIDSSKVTEERPLKIDTPHTPFSPQGWESFDVISPVAQAGFYNNNLNEQLSPSNEKFGQYECKLNSPEGETSNTIQFQEKFVDICSLPVVIGDLTSDKVADMNPWPIPDQVEWPNTLDTQYNHMYTNTPNTAFIDAEDSLDLKFVSVIPREVESNNVVISEYIINEDQEFEEIHGSTLQRQNEILSVDITAQAPVWPDEIISTPEVLSCVEQLEKANCSPYLKPQVQWTANDTLTTKDESLESMFTQMETPPPIDYEPITPKSETHHDDDDKNEAKSTASKRKRHNSEDSDETYTPYADQPTRKYKRRKPSVPIKDMIMALEGQPKVRRGRPPKRRESNVSSVCSLDENSSSVSTQEFKYRELRDKNNEASKRSRMNRKLKELQMEQLATELEEKNKKLRVKADILEEMTKRLKNELMSAILKKK